MASLQTWPVPGPLPTQARGRPGWSHGHQAPPPPWLGVAQAAEWADRWVQLPPRSEVSEVLDCSDFQHPLDGQGLLGHVVARALWRQPRKQTEGLPGASLAQNSLLGPPAPDSPTLWELPSPCRLSERTICVAKHRRHWPGSPEALVPVLTLSGLPVSHLWAPGTTHTLPCPRLVCPAQLAGEAPYRHRFERDLLVVMNGLLPVVGVRVAEASDVHHVAEVEGQGDGQQACGGLLRDKGEGRVVRGGCASGSICWAVLCGSHRHSWQLSKRRGLV